MTDSKERGKALKSDFKSMYADFHIAGKSLWSWRLSSLSYSW
jgi:hypothetical protein